MKIRPGLEFLFPLLMSLSLFAHPASALEDEDPVAYGDSFCVQGECGYMRSDGEVLIPPEFTVVWFLEDEVVFEVVALLAPWWCPYPVVHATRGPRPLFKLPIYTNHCFKRVLAKR